MNHLINISFSLSIKNQWLSEGSIRLFTSMTYRDQTLKYVS